MTEICQKQHKQLKDYQKIVKTLEAQLNGQSSELFSNVLFYQLLKESCSIFIIYLLLTH